MPSDNDDEEVEDIYDCQDKDIYDCQEVSDMPPPPPELGSSPPAHGIPVPSPRVRFYAGDIPSSPSNSNVKELATGPIPPDESADTSQSSPTQSFDSGSPTQHAQYELSKSQQTSPEDSPIPDNAIADSVTTDLGAGEHYPQEAYYVDSVDWYVR